ncbi:MAG TPA: alpha-2-macroglobulin family protein [Polyangia bacterium]|jgi:uncharacterized protein YfaS (alpha-2-macroglobulin family)
MLRSRSVHRISGLLALLLATGLASGSGARAAEAPAASWKHVEALVSEQKLEAAAAEAGTLRELARKAGDDAGWAKALIREVQLRIGLHGYETAVRFLREEPWPKERLARATLLLFQANAYVTYSQAYGWEIGQRERVASAQTGDLKTWTLDQIFAAATASYVELWKGREALGAEPVARLGAYVEANNYPAEVRGTLRDALSYLFIELLGNTQGWRPEQSNEIFTLDLAALLKGDSKQSRAVNLNDPAVHPLQKIAAILDDLEAWHLARRERDAALETRLVRARTLFGHFTEDADREVITKDLAGRLGAFKDRPWWSMGNGVLAELEEQRGRLTSARALAEAGAKAHAGSAGALLCRAIVARLDAPSYQLSAMQADGLGKRSLLLTHKNVQAITLRAYPIDLVARFSSHDEGGLLPGSEEMKKLLATRPAKEWTAPLPATSDLKAHHTYVTPPLDRPGAYVILASARPDFASDKNLVTGVTFIATTLLMIDRDIGDGSHEVEVMEGASGKPVANAEVVLYGWNSSGRGYRADATYQTNAEGVARFPLKVSNNRLYLVLARHGGNVALDTNAFARWQRSDALEETRAFVYTDRSVYRPQQKVLFKVVVFNGRESAARYRVVPDREVTVSLRDPNGEDVTKLTLKTNAYGSVAGEFVIPAGRLLGGWTVVATPGGEATVRVEEYKRPTFEVKLIDPKAALRLNQPAALEGEAKYYFGLPVAAGTVRWRVTREPVYPWWWGWFGVARSPGTQTVATGTAKLDATGHFPLLFTPRADERNGVGAGADKARDVTYRYRVVADVTEDGGETRTGERAFRLGFVGVETRLTAGTGFFRPGAAADMTALRTDLDGVPRPGNARWRLVALVQPAVPLLVSEQPEPPASIGELETPGDRLRPRWEAGPPPEQVMRGWPEGAEVAEGALVHDAKGVSPIPLPALKPGAYRLGYETQDSFGVTFKTQTEFVVAGADKTAPVALAAVLLIESATVAVGGTARLLATSGFPDQPMTLDVWRDGKRVSHRRLLAGKDPPVIELPVRAEDRGGFAVSLTAARDHQLVTTTAPILVPWDDRELQLTLSSFRDKLRPGAKESWKVSVKAPPGARAETAAAELLAYMYDRSLDLFAPHNPPSPMSLWPNRASAPALQSSLGQSYGQWIASDHWGDVPAGPSLHGDRLKEESGYGIGGLGEMGMGGGGFGFGNVRMRSMAMAPAMAAAPAAKPQMMAKSSGMATMFADKNADKEMENAFVGGSPSRAPAPAAIPLRADFSETAFWRPHLLTDRDGVASIEFTVPDSVTSWNVWVHAVSKDLSSGSLHKETQSLKDLMVRPNMPRFLREGDKADLKVQVNNASAKPLAGQVHLAIVDPETDRDVSAELGLTPDALDRPFKANPNGGASVTFTVTAPRKLRQLALKVTASAGDLSDGELRALPILPSRVHLIQSRFVTLHDKDRREMTFKDLTVPDPTRINEQLVVTVDAQLFTTVLQALPYLITYPYECTEQTLNRFLSSAIVSSVFRDFPAVAKMAKELSGRKTPLEPFDAADPNRKMALEETPWLEAARGDPLEKGSKSALINVLDPKIAAAERASALAKLAKAQLPDGAFPWFPGGPADPYMTLYLMSGFAKAAEFKVDVPKPIVERGWQYLARVFREQRAHKLLAQDCCWEWLTFLGYVASSYPDPSWTQDALTAAERKEMLTFSFKHWKEHSPYLKGLLALTLKRAGRAKDAKLVWSSVMDSAKTRPDEGTFWAPEDRSWLWYNDTIETHAFALRALMELDPDSPKKDGLALWLLLHKKLNQWKSTRATAEVIYALVHYLKQDKALGVRENARVTVGGKTTEMVFEPDSYTGKKSQIVVPGPEVGPRTATVTVEKDSKGFAFASATWHFSTEQSPTEDRGDFFSVSRTYFLRDSSGKEVTLTPLKEGALLKAGDELEVHLSLRTKHAAEYVHLRDPRGAGFEPENAVSQYKWDLGISYYEETRDSGANFFFSALPVGEYPFKYRLRASMAGTFHVGPATVQSIYAPEFNAYSTGAVLTVVPTP